MRVYKFDCVNQPFLLAYLSSEATRIFIAIGPHENFYRDLKRCRPMSRAPRRGSFRHPPARSKATLGASTPDSLAREALGWQPGVTLEDGLKPAIAFFRPVTDGEWL
ncbi:type II toxin-antitoxin system RelE/ParE family toxin [Thiorhodovibrio frisius]|uniref:type II toxin-antitoxin system RelE/ParE family toxin n=1 Tax=Thiorhodovibrio frisius TaxID=631362 RepID=UPI001CBDE279|nr:type II toxin-antitoxin system RelE/ParE family toxin [Thiorhodovibrio frisius]